MSAKIKKRDLIIFGLIWAMILLVLSFYPLLKESNQDILNLLLSDKNKWISLGAAAFFLFFSIVWPKALLPLYKIWIKIGDFIGGIVSRVILVVLFFLVFTPVGLFLKLFRKDLLNKKIDPKANSYWIHREKQPESLKNQF